LDLVLDANILFAALIRDNITSDLMLHGGINLYAPEYIFKEFEDYKVLIKRKTNRSDQEFENILNIFERRINLVPYEEIKQYIKKAKSISPDIGDVPYFALALKDKIPIWSNDKDLKKKQNRVKIYSTHEIIEFLIS
jgi:predicted nucleic acid-binding protein